MSDTLLEETLDALEEMCFQYLSFPDEPASNELHHSFMSAGEAACNLLCQVRPDRWRETGDGMEYIGPTSQAQR